MVRSEEVIRVEENQPRRRRVTGGLIPGVRDPALLPLKKSQSRIAFAPDAGNLRGDIRGAGVKDNCFPVRTALARRALNRCIDCRGGVERGNNNAGSCHCRPAKLP
jgi:hypothetical protein